MANVFVEPTGDGKYQIEFADGSPTIGPFSNQKEAFDPADLAARSTGRSAAEWRRSF